MAGGDMVPAVSVVIPTYNGARFICEAIESARAQSVRVREVLVVDDCSKDGTAELVRSAYSSGGGGVSVEVVSLAQNSGGPAVPINVGAGRARGELVLVLDQDDVLMPDALRVLAKPFAEDAGVDCVFGRCGRYEAPAVPWVAEEVFGRVTAGGEAREGWVAVESAAVLHELLTWGNFVIGWPGYMFRKSLWARKGGTAVGLRIASDYDFLCWAAAYGRMGYVPEVTYGRREHEGNLSTAWLPTRYEVTLTRAAYVRTGPGAAVGGPRLREQVAEEAFGIAYHYRERGDYRRAWAALRASLALCPLSWRSVSAAAKLGPHWLRSRVGRRAGASAAGAPVAK